MGRRGMSSIAAAIVMAGVVAVVGVASYVSLSSVSQSESSSSSIHNCVPVHAPQCVHQNSSASSFVEGVVLGSSPG
jgi:hypothetical protein